MISRDDEGGMANDEEAWVPSFVPGSFAPPEDQLFVIRRDGVASQIDSYGGTMNTYDVSWKARGERAR